MNEIQKVLDGHVRHLFPDFRSITGNGLRRTLEYIKTHTNAEIHEIPSGTRVLDWDIPDEWNIRSATLKRENGDTIIDFSRNNLHILHYSHAVDMRISRQDLDKHLHSLPDQPDLIPYRTGYYANTWGLCISQTQRAALCDDFYLVKIEAEIAHGSLSYGALCIAGETSDEVLFSIHCCHPSLANDNLSSIAVAIELIKSIALRPRTRFSYRFLFLPGTIGAIAWLHFNETTIENIKHGLVLSCLGDIGAPTYKRSRRGNAPIDVYVEHVLTSSGRKPRIVPFAPYGYDERQYCSPGFNLPVGCLMRSANGTFPEYHTSADDLSFVKPEALEDSLLIVEAIIEIIEADCTPINMFPRGEPMLGRRGLYDAIGGQASNGQSRTFDQITLLWILNQADGSQSLLDIAKRADKPFEEVLNAAEALETAGLISRLN